MQITQWAVAAAWLAMALVPSDGLAAGPQKVTYPKELLGVWDLTLGQDQCKVTDEGGDARFEITPTRLNGYEDWSEPLSVVLISHKPKAWRIKSRLHIYEDAHDYYEIYSLSGGPDPMLAVTDSSRAETYERCR